MLSCFNLRHVPVAVLYRCSLMTGVFYFIVQLAEDDDTLMFHLSTHSVKLPSNCKLCLVGFSGRYILMLRDVVDMSKLSRHDVKSYSGPCHDCKNKD